MKLFSIIIPIFNVEEYIKRCFDNVFSQGIDDSDFEIIAVNDGSPDNSIDYIEEYKKTHDNIIIINKPNGGVSSARNAGIENAKGKYLIFLDPDDYFADKSLFAIKNEVEQNNVDFYVLRSHISSNMKEDYPWASLFRDKSIISGIEMYHDGYVRGSVCGCIFCRDFINRFNIRFYECARNCEDTIFFFLCQIYAERIMFLNKEFYVVYERENSASRSMSEDKIILMFNNLDYVQQYAELNNITDEFALDMLETLRYLLISNLVYFCIWYNGSKTLRLLNEKNIQKYLPIKVKKGPIVCGRNKYYTLLMNKAFPLYFYLRLFKFNK